MAIRVTVVGLGARGREWLRTVRAAPGFELAGCVDTAPEALSNAAKLLGLPAASCSTNLEESLEADRPDAVIVATSLGRHGEPCREALRRGCAALVEKPFAQSVSEAAELVELARRAKVPLLVGQNFRHLRAMNSVRRLLESGRLGTVGLVVCQGYRGKATAASIPGVPLGLLWEVGVHHLDVLRYLLGREVVALAAQAAPLEWSGDFSERSVQVLLRFEGGVAGVYSAAYDSRGHEFFERGQEFFLRIAAENGTLHVLQRWIVVCERGKLPRPIFRERRQYTEEVLLLRQLERTLNTGEECEDSGRNNLKTVAILEACVRSAAERRWVDPRELLREASDLHGG